jgi:hypothetical protein
MRCYCTFSRSDSPGFCAKYGAYTVMEQTLNKVIDIQLVQVSVYFFCKIKLSLMVNKLYSYHSQHYCYYVLSVMSATCMV